MGLFNNRRPKNANQKCKFEENSEQFSPDLQKLCVFSTMDKNYDFLNSFFGDGIGMISNKYQITEKHMPICLAYIDSVADSEIIREHALKPLLNCSVNFDNNTENTLQLLQMRILSSTDTFITDKMVQVIERMLNGDTVVFLEKSRNALIIGSRKVEKRAVEGPENEGTVLGSQESFTDDLKTNICLIIKRLPVPSLHFEEYTVGTLSRTKVKLIWLEGIADSKTIEDARSRIKKIDQDLVDGIGIIGELIEDNPFSLLPKYRQTERPDVVARSLSDGRFAIICSNSPFALIAPNTFWDNFRSMDDYEERSLSSSYLRLTRYFAFLLSVFASPLYLSFVTFNHAIVPPALALQIASGRTSVPFPSIAEVLVLTIGVSIIREAGLRMPGSVGFFVSTLAAVVMGQAIVSAGYVSNSVIIVIAVSTIAGFALSTTILLHPARLLNLYFIILTCFFGMFGLINGLVFLFWYASTRSTFGVPYLYPVVPFDWEGMKDTFVRSPFSVLKQRMKLLAPSNRVRMSDKGIK